MRDFSWSPLERIQHAVTWFELPSVDFKRAVDFYDVLATIILLKMGTFGRFAGASDFASYARCVDSVRLSTGKKKGEGNTKNNYKCVA